MSLTLQKRRKKKNFSYALCNAGVGLNKRYLYDSTFVFVFCLSNYVLDKSFFFQFYSKYKNSTSELQLKVTFNDKTKNIVNTKEM